jgi:hypothetical protein
MLKNNCIPFPTEKKGISELSLFNRHQLALQEIIKSGQSSEKTFKDMISHYAPNVLVTTNKSRDEFFFNDLLSTSFKNSLLF